MKIAKYHRATTCLLQPHFDANISQRIQVYCSWNKTDLFCCWKKNSFSRSQKTKLQRWGMRGSWKLVMCCFPQDHPCSGNLCIQMLCLFWSMPILLLLEVDMLIAVSYLSSGMQFIELVCGIRVGMEKSVTRATRFQMRHSHSWLIQLWLPLIEVKTGLISVPRSMPLLKADHGHGSELHSKMMAYLCTVVSQNIQWIKSK